MKILRSVFVVLTIGAATISTANARDSFSLGINIGGYGYAPPPVVYYPAPATVYYGAPSVYYYEPAPVVRYHYYSAPSYYQHGWGHRAGHHGWGHHAGHHGRGHHGGHNRGHH